MFHEHVPRFNLNQLSNTSRGQGEFRICTDSPMKNNLPRRQNYLDILRDVVCLIKTNPQCIVDEVVESSWPR